METTGGSFRSFHPPRHMNDDTAPPFRQKPQSSVPVGQSQGAVDARPSELSGTVAPIQRPAPVWKTFVQNSEFQEANRAGIAAEQQQMREAARPKRAGSSTGNIFKGVNGRLIHKAPGAKPVEYDANEWVDDPEAGPEARKSLWDREIRSAREEAEMTNLELSNPAFNARGLSKTEREAIEAEGSMLQETDPRHVELKSKLVADTEYQTQKQEMAQRAWNAKARAAQTEVMDPESWWQSRQAQPAPTPTEQRQATVATAQDAQAQAQAADDAAGADLKAIEGKLMGGVTAEESKALQAQRAEILANRAKIAEIGTGAAKQIEGVQAEAAAKVPEKDFFRFGDTVAGIWDAVKGLGTTAPAAFYQLMEGMERPDQYSESAKAAFAEAEAWNAEMQAKTAANQAAGTSSSVGETFREAGASLGFSLGSMAAAIPASIGGAKAGGTIGVVGGPKGVAAGALIGGVTTGMAASGTAAYRMAGASFLNEAFQQLEAESMRKSGRPMNEEEKASAYEALLPIAKNTGLWEAGPEAVGNAVTMGAGKILFGLGKPLAAKFTKTLGRKVATKTGAVAGSLATELAGETITGVAQGADQEKLEALVAGEDYSDIKPDWSAGNIVETFKEIAPQTLALMAMMGGAGGAIKVGSMATGIGDYSKESKNAREMLEGVNTGLAAIDPQATAATADEMHDAAFIARRTDGPAEIAEAIIIERELKALGEQETQGRADSVATLQANLDAAIASGAKAPAIKAMQEQLAAASVAPASSSADLVRASLKIAAGKDFDSLSPEELAAIGLEEKKGKVQKDANGNEFVPTEYVPIKPAKGTPAMPKMVTEGADGSIILTDTALKAVEAASPRARGRIAMGATEAIEKAKVRAEEARQAALATPPAEGPANSTTPAAGGSGAALPNTFDVPMRDGTVMRVQAPNAEEALREAAAQGPIAGSPATAVAQSPTATVSAASAMEFDVPMKDGTVLRVQAATPTLALDQARNQGEISGQLPVPVTAEAIDNAEDLPGFLQQKNDPAKAGKPSAVTKARAIVEKAKRNKSLKARLIEGTERAATAPDGIIVNPDQVISEALASGMNEEQAVEYFARVLDEEIRHLAQYDAAKTLFKMAGGKGDFLAWMEAHYAGIWASDFAGTAKEATVRDLYLRTADGDAATVQAQWDAMSNGNKALEAIRMMSQGEATTESAKLWANISKELKNALRAALTALKKFADTASPAILQEIKNLENALSQLTGTSDQGPANAGNREQKQDQRGQDAGTPQSAEAERTGEPAISGGTEPGGLETPLPSAWVGKRVAFTRVFERLEGEVSFEQDTKRGKLIRVKLDAPDSLGVPTRAIFLDEMVDATGATISGFEDLTPAPAESSEWEQFPHDGTPEGMARAMQQAEEESNNALGDTSHSGSRAIATDADGKPAFFVSPNGNVDPIDTPDARYAAGDLNAFRDDALQRILAAKENGDPETANRIADEQIEPLRKKLTEYQGYIEKNARTIESAKQAFADGKSITEIDARYQRDTEKQGQQAYLGNLETMTRYHQDNLANITDEISKWESLLVKDAVAVESSPAPAAEAKPAKPKKKPADQPPAKATKTRWALFPSRRLELMKLKKITQAESDRVLELLTSGKREPSEAALTKIAEILDKAEARTEPAESPDASGRDTEWEVENMEVLSKHRIKIVDELAGNPAVQNAVSNTPQNAGFEIEAQIGKMLGRMAARNTVGPKVHQYFTRLTKNPQWIAGILRDVTAKVAPAEKAPAVAPAGKWTYDEVKSILADGKQPVEGLRVEMTSKSGGYSVSLYATGDKFFPTAQFDSNKNRTGAIEDISGRVATYLNDHAARNTQQQPSVDPALEAARAKARAVLDGLFAGPLPSNRNALRAAQLPKGFNQEIPADRFMPLMEAASAMVQAGVNTPEALAAEMDNLAADRKAVPFVQAFWFALKAAGAKGKAEPKWAEIYRKIDKAAEQAQISTEGQPNEQTQRDGNSGSAANDGTEESASRPGEGTDPTLDPSAGGDVATGGIQPGQPDGSGRSDLPGGSVPGSDGDVVGAGDNDGALAGDSGSGSSVDRAGVRNATRPELGSPEANFVIEDGFSMPKGEKARITANLKAITLLREIEAQGRNATLEEKKILSAYSGWGSFKNAFNRVNQKNWLAINERLENASPYYRENIRDSEAYRELSAWRDKWGELFDTLDEMLSPEEFRAMSKSIRNAHFTALPIIDSMWNMVRAMGFKGGNVLETSVGAGYFVGRQPIDMANVSKWSAVELDSITARVFSKLYPESRINGNAPDAGRVVDGQGFQKSKIPNNSQDLVIGNFPFAKDGPMESLKEFGRKLNLHNYFFARSIDKLKPGGILIAITSNSTMDNNIIQRELIAGRVELVQAIRLPNDAFKENAGTEVTTDILILRKKDGSRDAQSESWTNVESVGEDTVYAKQGAQSYHAFLSEISPDWVPVDEDLREPWKEWRAKRPKSGVKWDLLTSLINNHRYGSQGIPFRAKMVVNEYFARHPEAVIGRHALEGSMYSAGSYAVVSDGVDVQARLNDLIRGLPSDLFEESELGLYSEPETIEASAQHRNGSIVLVNDQPHHVVQGELIPVRWDLEYTEDFLADAKEVKAVLAGNPELKARFAATFDTLNGNMLANWIDGFIEEHLTPETAKKIRDKIAKEVARRNTVFKSWVKVRDSARALMDAELRGDPAGELYREALNQSYDAHVAEHGAFSARSKQGSQNPHKFLFDEDDSPLLESLEDEVLTGTDDKGKPIYRYEKRPIFTESMVSSATAPTSAKDIKEAVGTSMGYKGRISLKYMASLLKVSKDEAAKQLAESGLAFKNPKSGLYETADFYLSGEVRAKLREAEEAEAFEPGIYQSNIEALTKIIPENRPIQAISVILGNRWLPGVIYSKFAEEKLGMDTPEVRYEPAANGFKINTAGDNKRRRNRSERDARAEDPDYMGTAYMPPDEIFEYILNSREIRIMKAGPTRGSTVVDAEATIEAQTKADQMMDKFAEWVKTSKDEVEFEGKTYRISDLAEQEFNDKVAGLVTPTYVGEWVTLPGQSGEIWLKPHRKAVLARLLTMGYGMMAHGVGSGKTYNQIALAMELRRLGKARRPVTIVQNSTIRQFAASHMKAYPHAKILVADEENFSARKRARFLAKIATGDYDSIIMTHSNISQIGHDEQSIRNYMARAIGEMEEVLAAAEAGSQQQGDIQAALDQLQEKLEKLLAKATSRAGSVLTWEQLGVDALIVDEAHEFKNAPIITRKERIKNLPASGTASDRAVMMQMKTRSVQSMTGGKNIFFATGTPITNTMAEAYTMINFIAPQLLESKNINNFDDFATMFGRTVSEPEATWRGAIEMVERFAKFVNGPELVALIRSVFDVALGNENLGIRVPRIKGGGPEMLIVEPTEASEIFNDWVIDTAAEFDGIQNKRQAFQESPWMQAIPIMIMQAGMAQAIDPRLINPMAPDDPASKVNQLVARMVDIYKDGTERKTAQVVFTDLSNPFSTLLLKQFNGDPFAEYGDVTPEMADLEAQIMVAPTETPAEKKAKTKLVNRLSDLAEKRFSLMDDIKQKLIAADIPASEIFLADSSINPKKLKASFDKVNSGEIRIIIGSTARLGTGVNIQERLAAAHNLSPPRDFKPAMMEQRIGRIERQGNLHRDWADQALVHVVQKMAKISFDAKKLEDRYEMAIDWLEKNGTDKQKEIARKAEAQFEIIVINYGLKFSMDSSVYSMMKAKQKFIDQVLMGENVTDEFDDPMSAESNAFALMAAEAMGDENLKRRVILDGELNKLTALRSAYVRDKQNRENALDRAKGDISSLTRQDPDGIRSEGKKFAGLYGRKKRIVKSTKGAMLKINPNWFGHPLTAEQEKEPFEREVEAPVYRFGDQEIDTAKPDQTITKPLNVFIADAMVDAKDTGEIVTRDLTVNGERFVFAVSHYKRFGQDDYSARIVWPGKVAGRVVFEAYVNVSGESPASSLLDGLKKLSSPDYAEKYASNIEREIAMHQQTVATLEPLVANPRPFAEEQEWREKSRESIEVNRLLAQANSDPRKHRYFRSLSRMVGEDATEQILGIDGKEGLPDVAADVWNRMFVRFRLDRRGIANNPAAIAKRLRDVVDTDTGQAAAESAAADADGAAIDAAAAFQERREALRSGRANADSSTPRDSTPEGFLFPSSRYRKMDGRLTTLRGIEEKLATKLESLESRDMYGRPRDQKQEHAAKIEAAKKPLEKIRAEIAKIETTKYQETMRGEVTPLRAGPLPAPILPGSPEWRTMSRDERLAAVKRQKSTARQYVEAIKSIFREAPGTIDNPGEMVGEIKRMVGGMQPLRAGPLPAAPDFELFPAEWNSLNVPRAEMPQVPTKERPAFLQFLKDGGVKVTDEAIKPTAITPIQIEYFPAKVERAKGIPAERRVFVSADNYLLDGHHQWMAQRDRGTVNVTRIGLPVREAIATMFLFPGTGRSERGVKPSNSVEVAEKKFEAVLAKYHGEIPSDTEAEVFASLREKFGDAKLKSAIEKFEARTKVLLPHKESFDTIVEDIAKNHDAKPMLAPLKGRKRGVEKALIDYDGRVTRMGDIVRASIIAKTIHEVDAISEEIHRRFTVKKFKNRFSPPLPMGYSDMLFQVEITPGVIAELQVHIPEMIRAKEEAGHYVYEKFRVIENDPSKKDEAAIYEAQMLEIYQSAAELALARSTKASNSEAEISASYASFRAVFSDKGRGSPLGLNSPTGGLPGTLATGMSSTSKNLVPGGKSEAVTIKSSQNAAGVQDNSGRNSTLNAGPLPPADDVFRRNLPVNPALVAEAKAEREAFGKNMAGGRLAGFGSDRTRAEQDAIDAVYEFARSVQKNADTMKVAREMLARDPADIEAKLLDAATDKDFNLTPADHLAIQLLIDRKTQEAAGDPAKLAENGARMMAYRIMRGDAGRLLQIGYDRYMTPAERNLAAINDAIFSPTKKIQKVIASKPVSERAAFMRAAAEARVKKVEAELAKAGLSIAEITRKSDKLALEKSQLMKDVMKLRKTLDQNILKMIQHGATKADIKRRYGPEAAEQAQKVLTEAREELKAKIAPMVQAGMTMEQIVAKLGALQAGPIGNAAAPLSPEAIAKEIERILTEGLGMPAVLAEKPAIPRPKVKPVPKPKGSTPVPGAPTAINTDWSRPVFTDGLDRYTFDTKDRSAIMTRVENIRMLAGAVGKIDQLDTKKKAQALARLAEIDQILGKYGTDTNTLLAEIHAGKHIDDFRFNINDVQHVSAVARIISTMDADWIDKANEVLYSNMLSGLQTMIVNATASVPAAWEATVGRGFEMAINAALAPAGLADPLSPQWGETKYILKAIGPAWTRAVSNFSAAMQAQHPMFDRDVLNQQPDIERMFGGKGYRMSGSISGKKGDIIRIPTRILMATDDFNMTLFACADVGAYAFRVVKSRGLKPGTPQFDREMRIQVNTPGSEAYILAATRYKSAIFTNSLPSEKDPVTGKTVPVQGIGDQVGEWVARLNGALTAEHDSMFIKLVQTLMKISFFPFQRVPFNILRKGVRYTPNPVSLFDIGLGMIQNSRTTGPNGETVWQWNANGRNTDLIARLGMQLQGAALLMLLVATAAGEGDDDDLKKPFIITGSMPFTPQGRAERDAQTRSGLGPSRISFRRKDGTERFGFNYGRLEPLATTLAATIDTIRAVKRSRRAGKDTNEAAAEALGGLVAQAQDKTFLRGVGDLVALITNAVAEPDVRENRKFQQFLAGRVAMAIPNIIKQPIRESDGLYRERSNDFMQEVLYQAVPHGQKPAKITPWGEQAEKTGTVATRIFDLTDGGIDTVHPVDKMLLTWRDSGKWAKAPDEADRKPWFPAPISHATFRHPQTGQTVKMTEVQLAEFREKAGKATAAKLRALSLNYESPTITDIEKVRKAVTESRSAIKAALAHKFSRETAK